MKVKLNLSDFLRDSQSQKQEPYNRPIN